jgi:hypothetical protein
MTTVTSGFLAGRGDDDALGAALQVLGGIVAIGEAARAFEHDLHTQILPRKLGRILLGQDLELVAVHADAIRGGADIGLQVAENRVVLEQMGECRRIGEVVDRDDVDIVMRHRRAQNVATDSTETVDANLDGHALPPGVFAAIRTCNVSTEGYDSADVHALYTLVILVLALVLSPWFFYQAIRYRKVLRQPRAAHGLSAGQFQSGRR